MSFGRNLLNSDQLHDHLSKSGLSRCDLALIALATQPDKGSSVQEIRSLLVNNGIRKAKDWNISDILAQSKSKAVNKVSGWVLTHHGKQYISSLLQIQS